MIADVTIERRFRGPPHSANGGYACGVVAGDLEGPVAVTLRAPPLGQLTARIDRRPEIGEALVVMGWPIERAGRKHRAGSALATAGGEVIARASAVWIEVDRLPL